MGPTTVIGLPTTTTAVNNRSLAEVQEKSARQLQSSNPFNHEIDIVAEFKFQDLPCRADFLMLNQHSNWQANSGKSEFYTLVPIIFTAKRSRERF